MLAQGDRWSLRQAVTDHTATQYTHAHTVCSQREQTVRGRECHRRFAIPGDVRRLPAEAGLSLRHENWRVGDWTHECQAHAHTHVHTYAHNQATTQRSAHR